MKPIMFLCDQCDQIVSRGDAEYINGEWQCPRHDRNESVQAQLVTDGSGPDSVPGDSSEGNDA